MATSLERCKLASPNSVRFQHFIRAGVRMESDSTYFARRAADERAAAANSRFEPARRAHLELAERYDDLHRALAADNERSAPSLNQARA